MLSERTKAFLRIRFERELYNIVSDTFYKDGLESALFLLKESPLLISEFADRNESKLESVLFSEQKGDCN
jgi:hypothetical protein